MATKLQSGAEEWLQRASVKGETFDSIDKKPVDSVDKPVEDVVFGVVTEEGLNYRSLHGIGAVVIMVKSIIGLGVLAIPTVLNNLGLIPGVIAICLVGFITWWSTRVIGLFKLNHPEVYAIDDAGGIVLGKFGREIFGAAFCILFIFSGGSLMLGTSIGLNAISEHGTCTAVFVAVSAIIIFLTASVRTLNRMSWLAWVGVVSVIVAVMIVTIAVGVQDRPATAPPDGPWKSDYVLFRRASFREAMSSLSTLVFSYCGVSAYFSVASEMRDMRGYPRAAAIATAIVTGILLTIGIVVYYYCGTFIASPALGSAGPLLKKISYGVALPGLLVTGTILTHYASKIAFVRILRDSRHLTTNTVKHWVVWLGCTSVVTIAGYLVASAIPIFGLLVSLVGALFGTLISVIPMGWLWLHDNWHKRKSELSGLWVAEAGLAMVVIAFGVVLLIGGTYSAVADIVESYSTSKTSAWSCADNSN